MFKKLFFVLALASLHQLSESYSSGLSHGNLHTLRRFGALAQALKFGDDCSWEAEEARQNYTRLVTAGNFQYVFRMANEFLEKDYKLCSATELFVCDKESQKCVCGDSGYETFQGVNRSLYISEANGKCRWNKNSYCVSEEFLSSTRMMGYTVDSKCKTGTTCKTGEGQLCSKIGMIQYLMRRYGFMVLLNERLLRREMMSGRVCSCKADQVANDDDDEWDVYDSEPTFTTTTTTTTSTSTAASVPEEEDANTDYSFVDAPAANFDMTTTPNPGHNSIFSDEWEDFGDNEGSAKRRRKRSVMNSDFQMKMIAKYAAGPVVASYMN